MKEGAARADAGAEAHVSDALGIWMEQERDVALHAFVAGRNRAAEDVRIVQFEAAGISLVHDSDDAVSTFGNGDEFFAALFQNADAREFGAKNWIENDDHEDGGDPAAALGQLEHS